MGEPTLSQSRASGHGGHRGGFPPHVTCCCGGPPRLKTVALDDENCLPYFANEAIIISIQTQDSICVNLGLYMINKIIGFHWELAVSVFRDPII